MKQEYTVTITDQALAHLEAIRDYISVVLKSKISAKRVLDTLEKEIKSLATFPGRIGLTEEEPWHSAGVHRMPVKKYLVYFIIDEHLRLVHILAVVYGRRDQRQVLSSMDL